MFMFISCLKVLMLLILNLAICYILQALEKKVSFDQQLLRKMDVLFYNNHFLEISCFQQYTDLSLIGSHFNVLKSICDT